MGVQYSHLSLEQRWVIERMREAGHSQTDIGLAVGVDQSTISRELRRLPGQYRAGPAHREAQAAARIPTRVPVLDWCKKLVAKLQNYMKQRYSITQALILAYAKDPSLPSITTQAVYDWLYSSETPVKKRIRKLMIRPRRRRQPRRKTLTGQGKIRGMLPISARPEGVNDRSEFGHYEGDLVIGAGGKSAIATLVERKTRFSLLIKVRGRTSIHVISRLVRRLKRYYVQSITWDQGKELAEHATLTKQLGIPVYFADAHSPWQRPSNENTNGVIRRHLPKGVSLDVHPNQLTAIQTRLNNRPMKVLSWQTPKQAYQDQLTKYALRA